MPVNSWTMARKFVVSVVSTVVGARLEALDLFFGFRTTLVLVLFCSNPPRGEAFSGARVVGKAETAALTAPPPRVWLWPAPSWVNRKPWLLLLLPLLCGEGEDEAGIKAARSGWDLATVFHTMSRLRIWVVLGCEWDLCVGSK